MPCGQYMTIFNFANLTIQMHIHAQIVSFFSFLECQFKELVHIFFAKLIQNSIIIKEAIKLSSFLLSVCISLSLSFSLSFSLSVFISLCPSVLLTFSLSVLTCQRSSQFIFVHWRSYWCKLRPVQFIRRIWRTQWMGWEGCSSQVNGLLLYKHLRCQ